MAENEQGYVQGKKTNNLSEELFILIGLYVNCIQYFIIKLARLSGRKKRGQGPRPTKSF